mgnify:CR=1 FL=1
MTQKQAIQLFEDRKVRTVWDERTETWYFSVLDVISALTDTCLLYTSPSPRD